jgi:hypothetical protein
VVSCESLRPDQQDNNHFYNEAGIYYLDWRENGKRQHLSVGRDSDAAHQRKIRKLAELRALSQGLVVTDVEE